MKVVQKPTSNVSSLRSMVGAIKAGSFAAYEVEQKADAAKIGREVEAFIGNELKPVTVVLIKQ
jgi:hypothetical protein